MRRFFEHLDTESIAIRLVIYRAVLSKTSDRVPQLPPVNLAVYVTWSGLVWVEEAYLNDHVRAPELAPPVAMQS